MDAISSNDIKDLLHSGEETYVSIIMPTHQKGGAAQQNLIRFKNLLRSAEDKLLRQGLRLPYARAFLKPVEPLLTDSLFWRQQGNGLAIYLARNRLMYYRLPLAAEETVEVGKRFFIRPLIPLLNRCGLFYILAISQNENRLLQCSSGGCIRINAANIPPRLAEAFLSEGISETSGNIRTRMAENNTAQFESIQSMISSRVTLSQEQILQQLEQINKGLEVILGSEQSPLVLAGEELLHALYQKVNTYPHLLRQGIEGNPDGISDTALRNLAWPLVNRQFEQEQNAAMAEYRKAAGTGKTADMDGDIMTASLQGRIKFLFIAEAVTPGFASARKRADVRGDIEDLVDLAVHNTLKHSGTIYVIKKKDMPGKTALLALLRY